MVENIPGSEHPDDEYWGHHWVLGQFEPFLLSGGDLDGDGLTDWGYPQFFSGRTPGCLHGPGICGLLWNEDPNTGEFVLPDECPGVENMFDMFLIPELNSDPNYITNFDANNPLPYFGPIWFEYPCFAQLQFDLYADMLCPHPGSSGHYCTADIDGSFDCLVHLADLAQLLANYGTTNGATRFDGDVEPYGIWDAGDGDVDLADLAELLGQYGNDCCGWP